MDLYKELAREAGSLRINLPIHVRAWLESQGRPGRVVEEMITLAYVNASKKEDADFMANMKGLIPKIRSEAIEAILKSYGPSPKFNGMKSHVRVENLCNYILSYIMVRVLKVSATDVCRLAGTDRSSIYYHVDKIESLMSQDARMDWIVKYVCHKTLGLPDPGYAVGRSK